MIVRLSDETRSEADLAEWYELAIANDNAPEAKPLLLWEWVLILAFTAVFWIVVGLLVWAGWSAAARWPA